MKSVLPTSVLVLAVSCNHACNALQILPFERTGSRLTSISTVPARSVFTALQANGDALKELEEMMSATGASDEENEETTLTLQGKISVASNELPKTSLEEVSEFFRTQANRNLLVTGGGERPCSEIPVTTEMLSDWKSRCLALSACEPDENDSILSVVTRGIEFPGLKVSTSSSIGVKYVEMERTSPRYEFVLLANEQTVLGVPPAVWAFRKLTGSDKNGSGDNSKFKSLTTVTYEEKENGKVVFKTDGFLSIGITFPKFLLKILPGDKKTIEERGGKSIVKTLDKDVAQSMKAFEKTYLDKFDF